MKKILFLSLFVFTQSFAQMKADHLNEGILLLSEKIIRINYQTNDHTEHKSQLDSLFLFALEIYDNDISEALLALSFACLPYDEIPLRIPVINQKLPVPLPSVNKKMFNIRYKKLPGKVLIDSPNHKLGDKDKLSHFFGNAFLSYNSNFINIARFFGSIVELFENAFYIEGAVDPKDVIVNRLGEHFGNQLQKNEKILPSKVLDLYYIIYANKIHLF